MPENIKIDELRLETLWRAQMEWAAATIGSSLEYMSDDGYDYLDAALELTATISMIYHETDLASLDALLNTRIPQDDAWYHETDQFARNHGFTHLSALACDGVCPEIVNLNPPALNVDF
jgi:hypothetical protein